MDEINRLVTQKLGSTPSSGPSLVGRRIGTYEILEEVGKGGMGAVYRAMDRSLDREVAVKVLLPSLANDAEFEKRFVREARAAAKLDHPNVVQTYYAGRYENTLFIAMQFVKGRTLQDLIKEKKSYDAAEALRIVRQAADALEAAHKDGLVHRDIKPNNIMIDEAGRVKVMDFGLMRSTTAGGSITQSGIFYGTPEYASPEQCETKNVDGRTDIYSLGTVLYEMLTGRIPHVAETPLALFKKITDESPSRVREMNPRVPKDVERIVERMMAKKRDDRYASCAELVADIDAVLGAGTPVKAGRPAASRGGIAAAVAGGIIAIACVVAIVMWSPRPDPDKGTPAPAPAAKPAILVFDFKNGTNDADANWYEIALSDMMIASLAQRGATVPTRDQLLWKVQDLRLGDRITNQNQRQLLSQMRADYYLTGKFYVRAQKLLVTLTCYRASTDAPAFPTLKFERLESEVFAMVEEMAAAVHGGLERTPGPATSRVEEKHKEQDKVAFGGKADDERGRQAQDAAAAPAPAAKTAPVEPAKGEYAKLREDRRNLSALGSVERAKHWYANQQLAEQCGVEEEDVKLLLADLKNQFDVSDEDVERLQKGIENFRRCVNEAAEARKQGVRRISQVTDFACPDCPDVVQKVTGTCPKCKAPLMMRITVQQAQQEPKK